MLAHGSRIRQVVGANGVAVEEQGQNAGDAREPPHLEAAV
jgi:hypothetical protein